MATIHHEYKLRLDAKKHVARGFTLVEISIALVIISIVMVGLIGSIVIIMRAAEDRESRDKLDLMKQRIIGYASTTQRLPKYESNNGIDEITTIGAMPRDFWERKLIYIYDPQLVRTDAASIICAKKSTNIQVRYCSNITCATPTTQSNVAFVAFSTGKNLINQTGAATTPHTEPGPDATYSYSGPLGTADVPETITVYDPGAMVGSYSAPTSNASENDDIFVVVTLDELRQRLSCQGTPLKIVNTELPMGAQNTTYSATIYADGGVPVQVAGKYSWCVESSVPTSLTSIATLETVITSTAAVNPVSVGNSATASCATQFESSARWVTGDTLRIKGAGTTPANSLNTTNAGTYDMTVYVRDNQNNTSVWLSTIDPLDNIVSRPFVLAIHGS